MMRWMTRWGRSVRGLASRIGVIGDWVGWDWDEDEEFITILSINQYHSTCLPDGPWIGDCYYYAPTSVKYDDAHDDDNDAPH